MDMSKYPLCTEVMPGKRVTDKDGVEWYQADHIEAMLAKRQLFYGCKNLLKGPNPEEKQWQFIENRMPWHTHTMWGIALEPIEKDTVEGLLRAFVELRAKSHNKNIDREELWAMHKDLEQRSRVVLGMPDDAV